MDLLHDATEKRKNIFKKIRAIYRENKKNACKTQLDTPLIIPSTNYVTTKHVRASVEYNGFELLIPALLLLRNINILNLSEQLNIIKNNSYYANIVIFNHSDDFDKYKVDLEKKKTMITDYINNFYLEIDNHPNFKRKNIKCIYISGKTNKHTKINELNKKYNRTETKSDIYVELNNGEIIGISIKQDTKATKSNYSVHKILGKEEDKRLTNIKNDYLLTNGFSKPLKKCDRENHNKLFYPHIKDNVYWNELKNQINVQNDIIKKMLVNNLYCCNVDYSIYEFNGKNLVKLNDTLPSNANVTFEEHTSYYYTKLGKLREAAKLFYRLAIGDKKYRVEVRWKGDIRFSPQFQIHDEP